MKTRGYIQPSDDDSPEQRQRWAQLDALRQQWAAGGERNTAEIGRLSQEIRREWLERRRAR